MKARWIVWVIVILCGWKASAVDIGQPLGAAPLQSLDGRSLTMDNYGERKGTVVLYLSPRSAAVDSVKDEINRIHLLYRLKEVLFVGVCANPGVTGDELRNYGQHSGMIFPLYLDANGEVARRLGATVTPQAFLLDGKGVLRYRGSLTPREGHGGLAAAIADLLAEKAIQTPESAPEGTPIAEAGAPRETPDPYGAFQFSSELVFRSIPGAPAHHCSTIVEAANGDLLVVWYGGSYESAEDQVLFIARRAAGERMWGAPSVLLESPGMPPGNAIIFKENENRLCVVWGRMESSRPLRRGSGWGQCRLFSRYSDDNGKTWSEDKEWPDSFGQLPRNAPCVLTSGELVLPMSGSVGELHGSFFFLKGKTERWERSACNTRRQPADRSAAGRWLAADANAARASAAPERIARRRPDMVGARGYPFQKPGRRHCHDEVTQRPPGSCV